MFDQLVTKCMRSCYLLTYSAWFLNYILRCWPWSGALTLFSYTMLVLQSSSWSSVHCVCSYEANDIPRERERETNSVMRCASSSSLRHFCQRLRHSGAIQRVWQTSSNGINIWSQHSVCLFSACRAITSASIAVKDRLVLRFDWWLRMICQIVMSCSFNLPIGWFHLIWAVEMKMKLLMLMQVMLLWKRLALLSDEQCRCWVFLFFWINV